MGQGLRQVVSQLNLTTVNLDFPGVGKMWELLVQQQAENQVFVEPQIKQSGNFTDVCMVVCQEFRLIKNVTTMMMI